MLLFNERISAAQASSCGLVTQVYPHDVFEHEVWSKMDRFAESAMPKVNNLSLLVSFQSNHFCQDNQG